MFFLLSNVSGISQPQNKKDSIEIARKAKFEIAKEDNGNVTVTFDFSGRVTTGKFKIVMQKGDNYVEIIETIKFNVNPARAPFKLYGEVFPSDSCNYMVIANEL